MKLHLGCGEDYRDGYVNIDFPPDKHTIQSTSVADRYADITKLRYKKSSIDEIRLHHLFEHFPRAQAIALFMSWNSWLKKHGQLIIEIPDFCYMSSIMLSPLSPKKVKYLASRHIFGSQEAGWAVHYTGWTKQMFKDLASAGGFDIQIIQTKSHQYLHNLFITLTKKSSISKKTAQVETRRLLSLFTVDDSPTEKRMLEVWLKNYDDQIAKTWAQQ